MMISPRMFHDPSVIKTGLSAFHEMVVTIFKIFLRKNIIKHLKACFVSLDKRNILAIVDFLLSPI